MDFFITKASICPAGVESSLFQIRTTIPVSLLDESEKTQFLEISQNHDLKKNSPLHFLNYRIGDSFVLKMITEKTTKSELIKNAPKIIQSSILEIASELNENKPLIIPVTQSNKNNQPIKIEGVKELVEVAETLKVSIPDLFQSYLSLNPNFDEIKQLTSKEMFENNQSISNELLMEINAQMIRLLNKITETLGDKGGE